MWAECPWVEALIGPVHCFNVSSPARRGNVRRNESRCAIDRSGARPSRMIVSRSALPPQFAVVGQALKNICGYRLWPSFPSTAGRPSMSGSSQGDTK